MGDLSSDFVVPAAAATPSPAAPTSVGEAPEPSSSSAGRAAPRCRRVHFPDLVASPIWPPPSPLPAAADRATAAQPEPEEEEDRMDLLWEDFNEELLATRRGPACSSESSSADGEESAASVPPGRGLPGCFPVLRPSARAGGAVRHYRRRAGSWVLLMRIFRRLFVIDKTVAPAAARRRVTSGSAR